MRLCINDMKSKTHQVDKIKRMSSRISDEVLAYTGDRISLYNFQDDSDIPFQSFRGKSCIKFLFLVGDGINAMDLVTDIPIFHAGLIRPVMENESECIIATGDMNGNVKVFENNSKLYSWLS